jgi:serine O-acetyltransferase
MFPNLCEDLRRYGGPWHRLRALVLAPRVWAIVAFRFARWVHSAGSAAILRLPLRALVSLIAVFIDVATNIELPSQVSIGPGLFLPHSGYIVVASNVVIGSHCTLTQGVTIGHRGGGSVVSLAGPVIGDRVYLGPGAVVLGPISIGDDVLIGANAVVTRSVPDRAVVVGNPARVISMRGAFDLVKSDGMDGDARRIAALAESSLKTKDQITIDEA